MKLNESTTKLLGPVGKVLSATKKIVTGGEIFNANVCTDKGKIWYGDVDYKRQAAKLQALANELKTKVYVLREMDARFESEDNPRLDSAVAVFEPKIKLAPAKK